ncbi:hypothetical protein L1887_08289 [Cichorium endivia]|nr:hypothetical protein L1887_08289 [Cichorium endivia]
MIVVRFCPTKRFYVLSDTPMRLCQLAISAIPLSKYFINCKCPKKMRVIPPIEKSNEKSYSPPSLHPSGS